MSRRLGAQRSVAAGVLALGGGPRVHAAYFRARGTVSTGAAMKGRRCSVAVICSGRCTATEPAISPNMSVGQRALVGAQQQTHAGAVHERQAAEIEDDALRARELDRLEGALERGRGRNIQFA